MRFLFRLKFVLPLAILGLVLALQAVRVQRVRQLTALPEWSVDPPSAQSSSNTGYASGRRALIVPDRTAQSQQWIAQAQQMLHDRAWRIERVDYDNAPFGRETRLPSLYRGWLAALAFLHGKLLSLSSGIAVEQVALYADPLLQILLAAGATWFVSRHFGSFAATLVLISLVTLYPLATNFIPGAPHPQGLTEACAWWSVLPLAAILWSARPDNAGGKLNAAAYFFAAGAAGGLGLWLNLNTELSVLAGIAGGSLAAIFFNRGTGFNPVLPWRMWALGGCLVSLAGYMADYFPARMTAHLDATHPLYALGWLATGELLQRVDRWIKQKTKRPSLSDGIAVGISLLGLAGIGFLWWTHRTAIISADISTVQITRLGGRLALSSLHRWIATEGVSLRTCAVLLPALLLLVACITLVARSKSMAQRTALVFALGPVIVTLTLAIGLARWWNTFNSVALAALAIATATTAQGESTRVIRWSWGTGVAVVAWLGLLQLLPPRATLSEDVFTPAEMQLIVERDLAHWLSKRHPGAVVLAPPELTTSLWFYGGLRGITTLDADNREGLGGALRIAGALTSLEALTLIQGRQVTYIVLPSWDLGLDESARAASGTPKSLFIEQLRDWILPLWLRPVAYFSPAISGFESKSLVVFEVIEDSSESMLLSQMATYFVEAGLPGHATALRKILNRYPTDLSVLVALADIEFVREDQAAFTRALNSVLAALSAGADRSLAWDRRIALASVLARGDRTDLARAQLTRCYAEVDESRLRLLTTRSLFRFLVLGKAYGLRISEPQLGELAWQLLPPDSRAQLR